MPRLHIVSDGTVRGTKVLTEKGERIENVTRVVWEIDADDPAATATVELSLLETDVMGDL